MQGFLTTMLWYGGAFLSGIIFGILFFVIFKKIIPSGTTAQYFKDLIKNFFGLLSEEEKFWLSYKSIIRDSFRYAGLQMVGVFLALLLIGGVIYSNSLQNQFVFDDRHLIVNNLFIRNFNNMGFFNKPITI